MPRWSPARARTASGSCRFPATIRRGWGMPPAWSPGLRQSKTLFVSLCGRKRGSSPPRISTTAARERLVARQVRDLVGDRGRVDERWRSGTLRRAHRGELGLRAVQANPVRDDAVHAHSHRLAQAGERRVKRMSPAFAAPYSGRVVGVPLDPGRRGDVDTAPPPPARSASKARCVASIGAPRFKNNVACHSSAEASGKFAAPQPPAQLTSTSSRPCAGERGVDHAPDVVGDAHVRAHERDLCDALPQLPGHSHPQRRPKHHRTRAARR